MRDMRERKDRVFRERGRHRERERRNGVDEREVELNGSDAVLGELCKKEMKLLKSKE